MAKQGRCKKCHTRYVWNEERAVKEVKCPLCGNPLTQTSYLCMDRMCFLHNAIPRKSREYPERRNHEDNWNGSVDNVERLVERG